MHRKYEYLHGGGCVYSDTPKIVAISKGEIAQLDLDTRDILQGLQRKQTIMQRIPESMNEEMVRLAEELLCTNLAKGLFFKRCNGQYINAQSIVHETAGERYPKMPPQMLAGREELVRNGRVSKNDVASTSYWMHYLVHEEKRTLVVNGLCVGRP